MAKGLIDLLLDQIFDAEWTGKHGEKLTERELKLVQLFGRKGKILRNVYLPKENGETSEVDVIYITQKGIFVFESKNYSGWIFGDEKEQYWTAMLPNKEKNKFYNPIKQNRTHLKWMKEYVGDNIPLFSIIVFSERCELKKIAIQNKDIRVIKRDRTYATVRDIWDKNPDAIEVEKIDKLYERLKRLTNVDEAVKAAHVANIEKKYKKPEKIVDSNPIVEPDTETKLEQRGEAQAMQNTDLFCPKCGGRMILRTARKGANAGNQFYGCENFPKCRFVKNI